MENPTFGPPNFESSGDSSESKEKSKKKKSPELIRKTPEQPEAEKKAEVAEKSKSLWEKLVTAGKESSEEPPEGSEQKSEISHESDKELGSEEGEEDATLEELTSEEEAEIEQVLAEQRLSELRAEGLENDDTPEAAEQQAAIEYLETQLDNGELVLDEGSPEEGTDELDVEHEPDIPADFEDDEDIPLSDRNNGALNASSLHGGRGGGSSSPPTPPTAGLFQSNPPHTSRPMSTPNIAPSLQTNPNALHEPDYQVNPNVAYLLVGGIVGYLIGRRRGRIKTERRMKVVQAKLEKQVERKQQQLLEAEQQVRRAAREQYEKFKRAGGEKVVAPVSAPETAPKAEKTLLGVEAKQGISPNVGVETKTPRIKELDRKEILTISEKIGIGNTNLRKVYESKLVSESGLKRLVYEHLEGNDIRRGLAREFLAKELSYERDPHMRDLVTADEAIRAANAAHASQDDTTIKSKLQDQGDIDGGLITPASSRPASQVTRSQVSTGILVVLTLIAIGLAAYAVLLGLTR
jgi:hypothetical protein